MTTRLARYPGRLALCLGLAILVMATSATASDEGRETSLRAERARATTQAARIAEQADHLRQQCAPRLAALTVAAAASRAELAALDTDMMAALTADDPAGMRLVRARLAACQAAIEANEGEKALLLKELEELDRDRDAWRRRAETMDLALRMDMKVMLSSPTELESARKRVDAAAREIENQQGQIRKYEVRSATSVTEWAKLRGRLAALGAHPAQPVAHDLRAEREREAIEVRRLASQQRDWFILSRTAGERARRNLAFARSDLEVSRSYAAALSTRADQLRATEAQAAADRADQQLAVLRDGTASALQRAAKESGGAAERAELALRAIAEARTPDAQRQAREAYAAAQAVRSRWEAEGDFWKEYLALQKSGVAFARERADRAKATAIDRSAAEIAQEERLLRDGMRTSDEYVRSLGAAVRKTDGLIESCCREMSMTETELTPLSAMAAGLVSEYDAIRPPSPDAAAAQLRALAARIAAAQPGAASARGRTDDSATTLAARLLQRELLRARRGISERWIESSRAAVGRLEEQAGAVLWRQHDARLNASAYQGVAELAVATAEDAVFAGQCIRHRIGAPGAPGPRAFAAAIAAIAAVVVCARAWGRRISESSRLTWLVHRLVVTVVPMVATAVACLCISEANRAFLALAWLLLAGSAWMAIRYLMLTMTGRHGRPAPGTAGDAFYSAVNMATGWSVPMVALIRLAGRGESSWDVQAVVHRVWVFCMCLVLFRLLLHPVFLGRLLFRRSEYRGMRWIGSSVAWGCVAAAALAALPFLAGLDSLGQTVWRTVQVTFVLLAAALAAGAIVRLTESASGLRERVPAVLRRGVQVAIIAGACISVVRLWARLLDLVILAPTAPRPLQDTVRFGSEMVQLALRLWHRELTPGMTVSSLSRGILVFALSFWVARVTKRLFLERVLARTPMDAATRQTFAAILSYAVILLGFLVGLNVAGSSLQNLALLAGAITVGLGFGLQNVINNFVSSLLIHFGRTIRVGDYIEVGGTRGTVREIGLRNTVIGTDDGITVLVPNGAFVSANIVNWTNPSRRTRLHIPLAVTRAADLAEVAEVATSLARSHALIVKEPAPTVEVRSATASQLSLELLAWTERPEQLARIVGDLNLAIDRSLRAKGLAV